MPLAGPIFSLQSEFAEGLYPTPRFWLESADNSYLIQIQKNAFLLNWRKGKSTYPHFDTVKRKFDDYYYVFCAFLNDEFGAAIPAIQISELQYSNVVEAGEYWKDASDTQIVIPSVALPAPGISVEGTPDFNYLTTFKHASDLTSPLRSADRSRGGRSEQKRFDVRLSGDRGARRNCETGD